MDKAKEAINDSNPAWRDIDITLYTHTQMSTFIVCYNPPMTEKSQFLMGRRRFLGVSGAVGAYLALKWGMHVPEARLGNGEQYPHPNWLYVSGGIDRPPIITLNDGKGIEPFLRYHVYNRKNRVLYEATRLGLIDFYFGEPLNRTLGDIFLTHVMIAKSKLEQKFKQNPTLENILLVAAISFGIVVSPYFRQEDFQHFGLNVDLGDHSDKLFLAEPFVAAAPHVFPVDTTLCHSELDRRARCIGSDRASHVVAHFVLGNILMHAMINNLSEARRIPNGSRMLMMFQDDMKGKMTDFSDINGYWFEWLQTLKSWLGKSSIDEYGNPIPTGHFDPLTWEDIKANKLGRYALAELVYDRKSDPLTLAKIANAIDVLNIESAYTQ